MRCEVSFWSPGSNFYIYSKPLIKHHWTKKQKTLLSSSKVPASSILRIPSPWRFIPGCGRHPQECSLQREGIVRMEDAGTSEEDNNIDSQDSNIRIDHSHLARNCSIRIVRYLVNKLRTTGLVLELFLCACYRKRSLQMDKSRRVAMQAGRCVHAPVTNIFYQYVV